MDPSQMLKAMIIQERMRRMMQARYVDAFMREMLEGESDSEQANQDTVIPGQRPSEDSKVPRSTVEAKRLRAEADDLKQRGNEALKDIRYDVAIAFYSDALNLAVKVSHNDEQLATLFSKRSLVFCKVKDFKEAEKDAEACVSLRPQWCEGYFRLVYALKGGEHYDRAFDIGMKLVVDLDDTDEEKINMLKEIVQDLANISDPSRLKHYNISGLVWGSVMQSLAKENKWKGISLLIQGNEHIDPVIKSYDASKLKLHGLLEMSSVQEWKGWGQRLAVKLLQSGAKKETLDKEEKYAIHAAFRVGMRTGVYDLLKHLFLRHIPAADRDRVDQNGNTLLHLACRETYSSKESAVRLLLEHKLDPTCRNKDGMRPLDLVPNTDKLQRVIFEAMKKKGYDIKCLVTSSATERNFSVSDPTPDNQRTPGTVPKSQQTKPEPSASSTNTFPTDPTSRGSLYSQIFHGTLKAKIWSKTQVETWLANHGLATVSDKLSGVCGDQLVELKRIQQTSPNAFYSLLKDQFSMTFVQILRMSSAVRELS